MDASLFAIIAGVVALAIMGGVWFTQSRVTRSWNRHKAETVTQWTEDGVEFTRGPVGGQFAGLTSLGKDRSMPGIGFVALTENDLRVTRSVPSRAWIITHKQIKGVSMEPKFLGREAKTTKFIVVNFVKDGEKDKIGFLVKDVTEWADALAQAAQVKLKKKTRAN